MKSKILCLAISLVMIVCALASCQLPGGGNGGAGDDYEGTEYAVTWDKTTVIFELTKNSNSDELSSGCERYYAGASTGNYETIDNSQLQIIVLTLANNAEQTPYLQLMSFISHALRSNDGYRRLAECKTADEMRKFFRTAR